MTAQTVPLAEIMLRARASLRGRWGMMVASILVYAVLLGAGQLPSEWIGLFLALVLGCASFLMGPPLAYGLSALFLRVARGESARVANLFDGFKCFGFTWKLYLWLGLYVILWFLPAIALSILGAFLLVQGSGWAMPVYGLMVLAMLPGFWRLLSYTLVYFVAIDNPGFTARASLRASREMMEGRRGRLLLFILRGTLWMVVGLAALFIGVLWAYAYVGTACAHFYEMLRAGEAGGEQGEDGDGGRGEIRTHG